MPTIHSTRSLLICLAAGLLASPLVHAVSDDRGSHSGTYRGRILTEQFLHEQSVARRGKRKIAGLDPEPAGVVRPDVGNIAVIDASDGVVIEPNTLDLRDLSIHFIPNQSSYSAASSATAFNDEARDNGIALTLGDDDAQAVSLPFPFPYFGRTQTQVFAHSDGNLTFAEPEASSTTRSLARAASGPPRVAPLFSDLDPSRVGTPVSTYSTADRFLVTWDAVPIFTSAGVGARQTFQLVLHRDGAIDFHYRALLITEAVVGIMPGFLEGSAATVDFSEGAPGPIDGALAEIFAVSRSLDTFASGQKFYQNHDDAYDFLVVFNSVGLSVGGTAFAFELNVRNEVLGIGELLGERAVVDFGPQFGSARRLQSYMNMGPLMNYPADPLGHIFTLGENNTLSVITHEAGHRFLSYVDFIDPATGLRSDALLGRQGAHWSFFLHTDASVLEGNRIDDRAMTTPRFLTIGTVEHYSELDQYLMGFRSADEVTPTFLVDQPINFQQGTRSAASAPQTGISFDGERKEITVDMIIDAEGERIPDASVSQRKFTFAFVLLVDTGSEPSEADIQKLENIRAEWEAFFEQAVDLRADAHTELVRELHLSTWPASGVVIGSPSTASVEIAEPSLSDLDVMLTSDNGGVTVPAVVTIPRGMTSVSFPVTGVAPGVTRLSAHATDPGYDDARTLIDVKGSATGLALQVVSGADQVNGLGGLLSDPVVLRATDANSLPYPGLRVNLTASRDGVISPVTTVTDARGEIRLTWRLATTGPLNTLTARLDDAPLVRTTVIAQSVGPAPAFTAASVVGAAGFNLGPSEPNIALPPGGLVSIFGIGLAIETLNAGAFPLPKDLGGTTATVNGFPASLLHVSPGQINLLIPFEITGGIVEIVVTTPAGTSATVTVDLGEAQPGIFFDPATGLGALVNAATGVTLWAEPLPVGATAAVFCAGLGAVEPPVGSGLAAPLNRLAETVLPVEAEIDGRPVNVLFSGLAPGFSGLYQVNIELPSDLPAGSYVLVIRVNGLTSNEVEVDIQ
jgi:uncharacterized protein (TIGR03437 family)